MNEDFNIPKYAPKIKLDDGELVEYGYATLPILSSIRPIYMHNNKYYASTKGLRLPNPKKSEFDNSQQYMLFPPPPKLMLVKNPNYENELNAFLKSLKEVKIIDGRVHVFGMDLIFYKSHPYSIDANLNGFSEYYPNAKVWTINHKKDFK